MSKMATMPIHGKNLKKSSSPELKGRWPWNLVCSIGCTSTAKLFKWWPWVYLNYFTAMSNLVPYVFVWEMGKTMAFSETIVVYDVEVGRCSKLCEYMNLYEYQRSRSFIDLGPRSLRFNIFKLFFFLRNRYADWSQISSGASMGWGNESLFKWSRSHDQYGCHAQKPKNIKKNLLFWNQKTDDLESSLAASGTQVQLSLFKWWHWVDLDLFYGKVKFGPLCLWERVKTIDFSETVVVYGIKVGRCSQLNEYMKLYKYPRSRSFTDLGPNLSDSIFLIFFSSITTTPIEAKFHVEPPWDGETKARSNGPGHMTKVAAMPIYSKNL